MSINDEMDKAIVAFGIASEAYTLAKSRTAQARSEETAQLNRVNEAQKRLDALFADLKKLAPRESDWHRSPGVLAA